MCILGSLTIHQRLLNTSYYPQTLDREMRTERASTWHWLQLRRSNQIQGWPGSLFLAWERLRLPPSHIPTRSQGHLQKLSLMLTCMSAKIVASHHGFHSIHLLRSVSLLSIQKSFAPLTMITFTRYPKQSLMKRSGNIEVFVVAFLRRTQDFCTRWCHSSGRARGYAQTRWQGPKGQFSMLLPFHFAFRFPSSSFCWLYISLQLSRTKPSSKLLHLAQWCRCCGLYNLRHVSNIDESKKWI
jgi:hypothetical protein